LRHEVCHALLAPLAVCAEDILSCAFPEDGRGPAYAFMRKKLTEALESVTQELAYKLGSDPKD
jgi:hypothetical protein